MFRYILDQVLAAQRMRSDGLCREPETLAAGQAKPSVMPLGTRDILDNSR